MHYRYPMNSFESLSECIKRPVDGTEMDVCVTKDSVLVLCHNQILDDNTNCSGLIRNMNWSDLQECYFKKPLFLKANIIKASYFFDRIERNEKQIFTFDCKTMDDSYEYFGVFARALLKHIEKYKLQNKCFIENFNVEFLKLLQSNNNQLRLFLYTDDCGVGIETSKTLLLYGLTLDTDKVSAAEIKRAHEQNLRITLFNASTERNNLEAIQKNPDFIQSDKVDYLINALRE